MKLSELSKLGHEVFEANKEKALKLQNMKTESRYIETIVRFNGVFDRLIYDTKKNEFTVVLCVGSGNGTSVPEVLPPDIAFYDEVKFKKVIITSNN
ncbi:MAG TPA: hypothetical protein VMV77_04610 [Bacteroidales bacterium]|nr:hypothetical protein [Bacteroidales bacterium]